MSHCKLFVNPTKCFIITVIKRSIAASLIMLSREDMMRSCVKEYTHTINQRYTGASGIEKGALLEEVVEVTGYHRKSAIRLLAGSSQNGRQQ